jgi:hypothetical protein
MLISIMTNVLFMNQLAPLMINPMINRPIVFLEKIQKMLAVLWLLIRLLLMVSSF